MMNEQAYIRSDIMALPAYSSMPDNSAKTIRLHANEAYWRVFSAIDAQHYPAQQPPALRQGLSDYFAIPIENLLISRGSDEAIDVLIRACCKPQQDAIIIMPPTFIMYQRQAAINAIDVYPIPLLQTKNFQLNLADLNPEVAPGNVKLLFITSPNNPTGTTIPRAIILQLCQQWQGQALIVVDEAYIEFSDTPSLLVDIAQQPNLVILRTLSKAHAMAGLRCGCTLANAALITQFSKVLPPYPLPITATENILEGLAQSKMEQYIAEVKQQRRWLAEQLAKLAWVTRLWDSQANFILVQVTNVDQVIKHCYRNHILLRDVSQQINGCLRISIGSPEHNKFLLEVLKNV